MASKAAVSFVLPVKLKRAGVNLRVLANKRASSFRRWGFFVVGGSDHVSQILGCACLSRYNLADYKGERGYFKANSETHAKLTEDLDAKGVLRVDFY